MWTFHLTKAFNQSRKQLYKLGCSHSIPSNEKEAYKANIDSKYFLEKIKVKLSEDDSAELVKNDVTTGINSEEYPYSSNMNNLVNF